MSSLRPLLRRLPPSSLVVSKCSNKSAAVATRPYVSRAHPKPVLQLPILDALDSVLEGVAERRGKREERWTKWGTKIAQRKGTAVSQRFIWIGSFHLLSCDSYEIEKETWKLSMHT